MSPVSEELMNTPIHKEELRAFCLEAMRRADLRDDSAAATADVLVATDLWGTHTHGTKQLKPLLDMRPERVVADAVPEVIAEGAGWGIVDGHHAIATAVGVKAMQVAIDKAAKTGAAYVGVRNSNHFGAAGYYANMAADADMLGISMTNTNPLVAVPGGRTPVIGTNPISYAVPAGKQKSVFLDIATSVVAASKVLTAKALGKPIPEGWIIDADGQPTDDPGDYPEGRTLLPMTEHKGYGIALLVEILAGVLSGAGIMDEVGLWLADEPPPLNQGHAFLAINIGGIMPIDALKARMDEMIEKIHSAPRAEGTDRIYLPGEMEWEHWGASVDNGMVLPEDVWQRHELLAQDFDLDLQSLVR